MSKRLSSTSRQICTYSSVPNSFMLKSKPNHQRQQIFTRLPSSTPYVHKVAESSSINLNSPAAEVISRRCFRMYIPHVLYTRHFAWEIVSLPFSCKLNLLSFPTANHTTRFVSLAVDDEWLSLLFAKH